MKNRTPSLLTPAPVIQQWTSRAGVDLSATEEHPLDRLTVTVAWRLMNPTNRGQTAREAIFERTASGKIRMHNRAKVVANGGDLGGYAFRTLSESDTEDVRGAIAHVLAIHGCLDDAGHPVGLWDTVEVYRIRTRQPHQTLSSPCRKIWKDIFSHARRALRINRKSKKDDEFAARQLELQRDTDEAEFVGPLPDVAPDAEATERAENERRARALRKVLSWHGAINRAWRADKSRKRNARRAGAFRTLRGSMRALLSESGHGRTCTRTHKGGCDRNVVRMEIGRFWEYVKDGRKLQSVDAKRKLVLRREARALCAFGGENFSRMHGISA